LSSTLRRNQLISFDLWVQLILAPQPQKKTHNSNGELFNPRLTDKIILAKFQNLCLFGAEKNGALQPMPGELGAPAAAISYFARCDREVAELLAG